MTKQKICGLAVCFALGLAAMACASTADILPGSSLSPNTASESFAEGVFINTLKPPQGPFMRVVSPKLAARVKEKYALNTDSVGWLQVPGTTVDDVVLWYPHDVNEFYYRRNFEKRESFNGSYYADYRCTFDTTAKGLSPNTVDQVLQRIQDTVEQPKHWLLFNRVVGTLSNLKNIGNISDVSNVLQSYNTQDNESVETSYTLLNGFLWAIPVLGFIGTVEGLSRAIGTFGSVLAAGADTSELTSSLQVVTGGLATAFETTLIALILALFLQLATTSMKKREDELLLDCSEYCQKNIIAHLRMPNIVKED